MTDTAPEHGWLIHKVGRGWYRPNAQGYTATPAEAGRYSHKDALAYSHPNGWDGPRDGITIKHESEVACATEADRTYTRAEVDALVAAAEAMLAAFYSDGNVTERHARACHAGVALDAALAAYRGEKP